MYEPKYLPSLDSTVSALPSIRFSVTKTKKTVLRDDPAIEPLHVHNYLEIFFNNASDVSFLVNNNLCHVPTGSAAVSRPGDIHMCIFPKTAVYDYFCLWVETDPASPIFSFLYSDGFRPDRTFDEKTRSELGQLLFALLDACEKNETELRRLSLLLRILELFSLGGPSAAADAIIPEAMQRILDDIQLNYQSIRCVNDILHTHFVSSATLTRWFRKYLHSTPREHLESVKLYSAAAMLSKGASVTDACMRSGFSDCSHFIVIFKKKFGCTPLQYKNK